MCAPTRIIEIREGATTGGFLVDPLRLGIRDAERAALSGGDAAEAGRRLRVILAGEEHSAASEAVALNAAAALVVAGSEERLGDAVERAQACVASGAAAEKLDTIVARARELSA